jgi:uncharacterized OsmC-like protein
MEEGEFHTRVCRVEEYKFRVSFNNKIEDIYTDEPEPLGKGEYPNAGKLLAAAVGNCLCASLVFCMEKSHAEVPSISAEVSAKLERNEHGRFRITHMSVNMFPQFEDTARFDRCRQVFEDFCIVTQSVRAGIPVDVQIYPVKKS